MEHHRLPAAGAVAGAAAAEMKEATIIDQVTIVATTDVAPTNDDKETGTHGSKGNATT